MCDTYLRDHRLWNFLVVCFKFFVASAIGKICRNWGRVVGAPSGLECNSGILPPLFHEHGAQVLHFGNL